MARTLWLRWLAALCGSLVVGCLFHRPGQLAEPESKEGAPATKLASSAPLQPADPPPPASPYSPIQPTGARKSASVVPLSEPVTLAVGHGPEVSPPPMASPPAPKPPAPDEPLVCALKCALQKHPDEAIRVLDKYDQNDRESLLVLIRLAAGIDEKDLERLSAEEVAATLERLRVLTAQLRQRAPLSLDKVCFCKTIDGFGQYVPQPLEHEFRAGSGSEGQPGERMQVYVEVRNFSSAARQDRYETRLSSSLAILDEQRQVVATMTPETSIDVSQTPRQDYFLNFQFHVPAKLKPGLYVLKVTVKDVSPLPPGAPPAQREPAWRSLDFKVGPPGAEREAK